MTLQGGDNRWWTGSAPFDSNELPSIQHTTLYEFQRGRFPPPSPSPDDPSLSIEHEVNTTELKEYVCDMGATYKYVDYYPVCTFPYINKGWFKDGENGETGKDYWSDVEPNDCSLLMHDAFGKGFNEYDRLCLWYAIISVIPALVSIFFLRVINTDKPKKDRKKGMWYLIPSKPNLVEKMLFLNIIYSFSMCIFCVDIHGFAGRVPLYSNFLVSRTTTIGVMAAVPIHLSILLVTAWITLIDGGKNKRTPRWAKWLGIIETVVVYCNEIGSAQLEFLTGDATNYNYAMNNMVTFFKYCFAFQQHVIYFVLCFIYGSRIAKQLKGAKDKPESAELKKIKKFMRSFLVLYGFSILWRFGSISSGKCVFTDEKCKVNNAGIPPCETVKQWWIIGMYWACAYSVIYVNQPGKKKYTTRLMESVKSTLGSTSGKSRKSTGATSKSGKTTGKSSTKGGSSTNGGGSSTESGSSGSSGSSENGSSGTEMSEMSGASSMASSMAMDSEFGSDASQMSAFESVADDGGEVEEMGGNKNSSKVVPAS